MFWVSQGTPDGGVETTPLKSDTSARQTITNSPWGDLCTGSQSGVPTLVDQHPLETCWMHRCSGPTEDILSQGLGDGGPAVCVLSRAICTTVQVQDGEHGSTDHEVTNSDLDSMMGPFIICSLFSMIYKLEADY